MRTRPAYRRAPAALKSLGLCLGVAFSLLASERTASAGFNATLNSVTTNNGNYITLTVQNTAPSPNNFGPETVVAGRLNWTAANPVDGLTGSGNTFGTFCIEIPRDVYLNNTYTFQQTNLSNLPTSLSPTMGNLKAAQIQAVWEAWYDTLVVSGNAAATARSFAAFQVAVWEIVYENGSTYGAGGGNFTAWNNSLVTQQANTYLGTVSGSYLDANGVLRSQGGAALARANVVGFSLNQGNTDAQDQIAEITPTPAPPALVLLVSGFFPLLAFRRVLKRTA